MNRLKSYVLTFATYAISILVFSSLVFAGDFKTIEPVRYEGKLVSVVVPADMQDFDGVEWELEAMQYNYYHVALRFMRGNDYNYIYMLFAELQAPVFVALIANEVGNISYYVYKDGIPIQATKEALMQRLDQRGVGK